MLDGDVDEPGTERLSLLVRILAVVLHVRFSSSSAADPAAVSCDP
jgi:hypothetical protein